MPTTIDNPANAAGLEIGAALKPKLSLNWQDSQNAMPGALAVNPNDLDALREFGSLRKEQKRFPEAVWAFGRVLEQKPDDLAVLLSRIECGLESGDAIGARLFCVRALKTVKDDAAHIPFLLSLAQCLVRVEDFTNAAETFRRILRLEPAHAEATESLEKTLAKIKPVVRAVTPAGQPAQSLVVAEEAPANGQRYKVTLINDGENDVFELSLDVYPYANAKHPLRHYGYWNMGVPVPAGKSVEVEVLWDARNGKVYFNGKRIEPSWQGEFKDRGECTVHLIVYRNHERVTSCHFNRHTEEVDAPGQSRPVLFHVGKVSQLKTAVWFLTWACNFKCPYCWEVQLISQGKLKVEPLAPAEKWAEAWNRIRPGTLDISGGEPFMQPNFIKMLQAFDDSIRVAITSNLSYDMTEFVQKISPNKVFSMTLSFHPSQKMSVEAFLGKALLLKNRGFNTTVNFVTFPEQLWMLDTYKKLFESHGFTFHVDPYAPTPGYPFQLSEKERAYIAQFVGDDRAHAAALTKNKKEIHVLCSGGVSHLNVQPNGDAYRCILEIRTDIPGIGDKVGNIFDPNFQLYTERKHCGYYHNCPSCDRDKVKVTRVDPPANWQALLHAGKK